MTLEEMKVKVEAVKTNNYAMMSSLVQGDINPIHCGYKSIEDGLVKCMKRCIADCEKLYRQYEKSNPLSNDEE